jgi:hypothetical protein
METTANTISSVKNGDFFCENCKIPLGKRTKEWCDYAGYNPEKWKPKYRVRCNDCDQKIWYATINELNKEFNRKMEESTQNNESGQPNNSPIELNWSEIESLIKDRKMKTAEYAASKNLSVNDFRQMLVDQYGSRLVFRRGRGGGPMFVETNG